MGTVFTAHDPSLDRLVAVKIISGETEVTEELRTRFYREAQACARLSHPNIITAHELGEDQGRLYIVMELLEGEELRTIIVERRSLSLEEKLALMVQVCEGLGYAHQKGVVHRDVKPGNVFVLPGGQVKILDFGIARIVAADSGLTRTGSIVGTLRYMAPEQARGRADHRSDIFSAGAMFYELISYQRAFDSSDPMELLELLRSEDPPPLRALSADIPAELSQAIERAMQKHPTDRFQDFADMRDALEAVRRGRRPSDGRSTGGRASSSRRPRGSTRELRPRPGAWPHCRGPRRRPRRTPRRTSARCSRTTSARSSPRT
jgi:eukaryotic-like serine/threonine-protein kinase